LPRTELLKGNKIKNKQIWMGRYLCPVGHHAFTPGPCKWIFISNKWIWTNKVYATDKEHVPVQEKVRTHRTAPKTNRNSGRADSGCILGCYTVQSRRSLLTFAASIIRTIALPKRR
jgi:hypothetical protein